MSTQQLSRLARWGLGAAALAAALPLTTFPSPVQAGTPDVLDWLETELVDNGNALPNTFGSTDWGLTLDAVLALTLGGNASDPVLDATMDNFEGSIDDYITGEAFGDVGSAYAGAIGKSLVAVTLHGDDPTSFGGEDLEALARSLVKPDGDPDAGRFSDISGFGDYSNGLGQALNVIGLAQTTEGVPTSAVDFLFDQQCPGGGFRLDYSTTGGCTSDDQAHNDATSFAVHAVIALGAVEGASDALAGATAWLLAQQDLGTGGFAAAPAGEVNTNSSGLAAHALRAVGEVAAADTARNYVGGLELTVDATSGTPAAGEEGAIAFNQSAYDGALAGGIGDDVADRDQWRRATAQAVLANGLGTYTRPNFTGVESARLLDSRSGESTVDGLFAGGGALAAGEVVEVDVAGRAGVPDDAVAVMVNVAVAQGQGVGFVTSWDCSVPRPLTSALNFAAGEPVSNAGVVPVSADGTICLYVSEGAQLILDVSGYFPLGSTFGVLESARLLDSRSGESTVDGLFAGGGALAAGEVVEVDVAGRAGVPDDAVAVMVNVAVAQGQGVGFVTSWDCSVPRPLTSALNFAAGEPVSNAGVVPVSADGTICLYVSEGAQLILDVTGSFM